MRNLIIGFAIGLIFLVGPLLYIRSYIQDREQQRIERLADVRAEGERAGRADLPFFSNPHSWLADEHVEWARGWNEGQIARKEVLK
jgi:hypothetical protein